VPSEHVRRCARSSAADDTVARHFAPPAGFVNGVDPDLDALFHGKIAVPARLLALHATEDLAQFEVRSTRPIVATDDLAWAAEVARTHEDPEFLADDGSVSVARYVAPLASPAKAARRPFDAPEGSGERRIPR
jgi:hypothetical protein